jgi:hypothetical protein
VFLDEGNKVIDEIHTSMKTLKTSQGHARVQDTKTRKPQVKKCEDIKNSIVKRHQTCLVTH